MKLELDDEIVDAIVVASIKKQIKYIKWDMKHSSKEMRQLNIADWTRYIEALEYVYRYYGGHLK